MKLNNKGFVVSTLMYALLVVFLFLIIGIITLLSNRKMILDKLKKDVKEDINGINKFDYYPDGTAIYYNPVTNKLCSNYEEGNSLNENRTGCMRWYTFNDNINKNKVNMILDHNTTYKVAWISKEDFIEAGGTETDWTAQKYNIQGPVTVTKQLNEDTKDWQVTSRLISADELAHIVGADKSDTLQWSQNKPDGTNIGTQVNWFYLDGSGNTYTGWQHQVADSTNKSKYTWLYDYTIICKNYGCNYENNITYGYWTKDSVFSSVWSVWSMDRLGRLVSTNSNNGNNYGVRPVITVDKKELKKSFTVAFDYTGEPQSFVTPVPGNYKIELWGAQGGHPSSEKIGGLGAYTKGTVSLESDKNLYIYVGEHPTYYSGSCYNTNPNNSFNGTKKGGCSGGGGATDVRLNKTENWYDNESLASRIIVSGAGGGAAYNTGVGGAGGELNGIDGTGLATGNPSYNIGVGATQTSYYFGQGADSATTVGGSGYYGGKPGWGGNAGGGSSYISGYKGCIAIKSKTEITPICTQEKANDDESCSYHYSGLKFTDMQMIAGNKQMPTHDGKSTMTGNEGNGYAKITYLGK